MEVCDFFHEEHDRMGKNGVHSPSHTHTQTHTHTHTHTHIHTHTHEHKAQVKTLYCRTLNSSNIV